MPSIVDDIELASLELVGDVDIAEATGAVFRDVVTALTYFIAAAFGLNAEALLADVEVGLGITESL